MIIFSPLSTQDQTLTRIFQITDADSVVRTTEVAPNRSSLNESDAFCVRVVVCVVYVIVRHFTFITDSQYIFFHRNSFVYTHATHVRCSSLPFLFSFLFFYYLNNTQVDIGHTIYVWIGPRATKREGQQSMVYANQMLIDFDKPRHTRITRVLAGQEEETHFWKNTGL